MQKIKNDDGGIALAVTYANLNMSEKYRIAAVVVDKRGRVISMRHNYMTKTHPVQAKYAAKSNRPKKVYLHAEIAALVRCGDREPHTIYVARVCKDGSSAMAKPCSLCSMAIYESGIKRVVYTLNSSEYTVYHVR